MNDILSIALVEIKRFLEAALPSLGPEWWHRHVVDRLTFSQQRMVTERKIQTLDGLDLAALLRVLDQNWYELSQRANLPREARSWVTELQTVRNKWAHMSSRSMPATETYRDVDTVERLLGALGASDQLDVIEARKSALLRELTARIETPTIATSIIDESRSADQAVTLFRIGELVALRSNPATIAPIIEILRTTGTETRYRVFQDGSKATYYESQLQGVAPVTEGPEPLTAAELRAYLTSLHLSPPSTHQLYSLRAGRINFVPYQYRPVMKLIRADRPRLLIADEVGVGKTIEAGLILKELRARMDLASVLVICPKALVTEKKWYREMKRFDEHFVALDGSSLRHCVDETHLDGVWPSQYARAILPMSLLDHELLDGTGDRGRRRRGLRELEPPPKFDLVIVDEAHHIRNPETATHQAVRYFCENAQAVVFLTATPLQLGTPDYFTLLNVLRPDLIRDAASFNLMSAPNPFIHEAVMECRTAETGWADRARSLLDAAASTEWGRAFLRERPEFQKAFDDLSERTVTEPTRVSLIRRIEELGTFSTLINRTRRRDIGNYFSTRKPQTVTIPFTPQQQQFHDRLLTVIAQLIVARHGNQNVKFLMTTIRRQAASCLFGLAPLLDDILRRNVDRLEVLESTDDDRDLDLGFIDTIQAEITSLRDMASALDPDDPKVEAFLKALREKQQRENNKVLVFSTFRHTLRYLNSYLQGESLRFGTVHGDVPDEDRSDLRRRFSLPREDAEALDVLLSSEVGSEGLDVQFCDYLVNYDLPWNPMKIEQRIGRLDRYGQKSESIVILNLITPGTVDADIYERCLLRIGVFHHAIGGSEAILGEITKKLHGIVDRFELTTEERQRQLQQMADNDIRRLQAQEELETEKARFFGLDIPQQWEADIKAADSPWLSPSAIEHCVTHYLASRTGVGHEMLVGESETKTLRLSHEGRKALAADLERLPPSTDSATLDWKRWVEGGSPTLPVTFDQSAAAENAIVRYLTLTHPLVRQAAAHVARTDAAYVDLTVRDGGIRSGEYRFAIYRWSMQGVRHDETLIAVANEPEIEQYIIELLRHAEHSPLPRPFTPEGFDSLDARHHEKWASAQANHAAENRELVEFRVQSLNASHTARRHSICDQLERTTNEKIHKMKQSELAAADADYERHLAELERKAAAGDIHATPVLFGTIRLTS